MTINSLFAFCFQNEKLSKYLKAGKNILLKFLNFQIDQEIFYFQLRKRYIFGIVGFFLFQYFLLQVYFAKGKAINQYFDNGVESQSHTNVENDEEHELSDIEVQENVRSEEVNGDGEDDKTKDQEANYHKEQNLNDSKDHSVKAVQNKEKNDHPKTEVDERYECYHKYNLEAEPYLLEDVLLSKRQPRKDKSIFFVISTCLADNILKIGKR